MPEAVATDLEPPVMPRSVLLVEDVEAMRLYLRYALERHGVQVLEAGDLETARQLLRSGPRPTSVLDAPGAPSRGCACGCGPRRASAPWRSRIV